MNQGLRAYLYFYPLVTTDITRKQLTNVEHAEGINAPMNYAPKEDALTGKWNPSAVVKAEGPSEAMPQ